MKILLFVFFFGSNQLSQPERLVSDFYSWYIDGGYREMKPTFRQLENGMTDMDFNGFDEAHRRFHFSDKLIDKSKAIYKDCRTNLSKIPFREFQMYQDLDQFESIGCSFQFWQWFGTGMEPFGYHELTKTEKLGSGAYRITIGLAYNKGDQFSMLVPVTVEQSDSGWEIADVGVVW